MPDLTSQLDDLTANGKYAFRHRLWAGDWWTLCESVAQGQTLTADNRAALAALPAPDSTRPPDHPLWADLVGSLDPPAGPGPARHPLATALLQLHCARLAAELDKGWTARGGQLDEDQARTLQALAQATGRPERELHYWISRLTDPTPDPYRQRVNALWVNQATDQAGLAFLILGQLPAAPDLILRDPRLAFWSVEPDFGQAIRDGWQAARTLLHDRDDLAWPADTGLVWDWDWRGHVSGASLKGPSVGGAFALAAYLLQRRVERAARGEDWTRARNGDDSPLLDPEIAKGIAVSAEVDPPKRTLKAVGGIQAKLHAATRYHHPHLHTVLLAGDQGLVAGKTRGLDYDLAFAQTLDQGMSQLELQLADRWSDTRLYGGSAEIARFLPIYLGRPGQPIPFGGRTAERQALADWLADDRAPPYLLLVAPAGRGKSALLARWVTEFWLHEQDALLYLPLGPRADLHREPRIARALLTRLCALHGEPLGDIASRAPGDLFERSRGLLGRPLPDGRRLLAILDGVDEAADWHPLVKLFPLTPPTGLRVVVAARTVIGESDRDTWRDRLGWDAEGQARVLDLELLDPAGIRDVLHRLSAPLDQIANDEVIAQLHRITDSGDPLLVGLWVGELWRDRTRTASQPTATILSRLGGSAPGLDGFFDRWWKRQEDIWTAQSETGQVPLERAMLDELLAVFGHAKGPLLRQDLIAHLLPGWDLGWRARNALQAALEPLHRFLIGDGVTQGYQFQHRRFGEYFAGQVPAELRADIEARFLDWGARTLRGLNAWAAVQCGTQSPAEGVTTVEPIAPHAAPAYLLQYYGRHLNDRFDRQTGPARTAVMESLEGLVTEGWLRAWEYLEDATYSGFLEDVDIVFEAAAVLDQEAAARGEPLARLGTQIRCVLCHASVNSLSSNLRPELIVALVQAGLWRPEQGLISCRYILDELKRCQVIGVLAPHLPASLFPEALTAARAISNKQYRAQALAALAPHLSPEQRNLALADALAAARAISDKQYRADALAALAPHLPPEQRNFALDAARAISDKQYGADALAALAPHLPAALLPEALTAARAISNKQYRAQALVAIAPHLPPEQRNLALADALAAARAISDKQYRADALAALAPHLPPEQRNLALADALADARAISDKQYRADALAALAPHLPLEQRNIALADALAAARGIFDRLYRTQALAALAHYLPLEQRNAALNEALLECVIFDSSYLSAEDKARTLIIIAPHLPESLLPDALSAAKLLFSDAELGAQALAALAPHLPASLLPEALADAWAIHDKSARARALAALAPHLPASLLPDALAAARKLSNEWVRADALVALAPHLPASLLPDALAAALAAARTISDKSLRANALTALAPHLPPEQRNLALTNALAAAGAISEDWGGSRADALAALAPHLPALLLPEALYAAWAIHDKSARARALDALAPHLAASLLPDALAAARTIPNEWVRADALVALAPHLPESLLPDALAAARTISREWVRADALTALTPHLPPEQRNLALAAARAISEDWGESRTNALATLAPHLPASLLPEAHAAARAFSDEKARTEALVVLALQCSPNQIGLMLNTFETDTRSILLRFLQNSSLVTRLSNLTTPKAMADIAQAIVDTSRWWP
jgi:hypothetical protein